MLEFMLFLVVIFIAVTSLMGLCDWAAEHHRVPFFVKAYKQWCRAEGEYIVFCERNKD